MNVAGKTVLVTGGGSGIGLELARRIAAAGATVRDRRSR
jgi:NAD(P)-dependent dehydrogenase (short-subunit alcohol dehydrogenase family)